jgi:hypothetical protein
MLAALVLLLVQAVSPAGPPKLPFVDRGACPFECCQYARWTAERGTAAFKSQSTKSGQAFAIESGKTITAMTGEVITRRAGIVRVLKPTTFAGEEVPAGAVLYVLHSGGEGTALYWFNGRTHWAELFADSVHKATDGFPWDVLSVPSTEWWVKVRNERGVTGWVLNPRGFKGMDGCG